MRVIIYEEVNLDIGKAKQFGDIAYMFRESDSRPSIWETDDFIEACERRLDELQFDNKCDYFAVVGSNVPVVLITSLLTRKYGAVKFLFWHSNVRDYLPRLLRGSND